MRRLIDGTARGLAFLPMGAVIASFIAREKDEETSADAIFPRTYKRAQPSDSKNGMRTEGDRVRSRLA